MSVKTETEELKLKYWADLIHQCSVSGLTQKKWMEENGIKRDRFYYWQKKLRARALQTINSNPAGDAAGPHALVEITQPAETSGASQPVTTIQADDRSSQISISVKIADTVIDIRDNASPELFRMVLREIRNAE